MGKGTYLKLRISENFGSWADSAALTASTHDIWRLNIVIQERIHLYDTALTQS